MPVSLILGGARSGKSRRAEALACSMSDCSTYNRPLYIATAPLIADDLEWLTRIERHRQQRGEQWELVEEELALAAVLQDRAVEGAVVLVDCLTLWLSNLMFADRDIEHETEALCAVLPTLAGQIVLVSNETGMGLVPENIEGRTFRDAQGRLNQAVAGIADQVEFVVAGLPLKLK